MKILKEKRVREAEKYIDKIEVNSSFGFILSVLKEECNDEKFLKELFEKAIKFKIPLPNTEKELPKQIKKILKSTAKKFRKESPELLIILAQAFKAVMINHLKQKTKLPG